MMNETSEVMNDKMADAAIAFDSVFTDLSDAKGSTYALAYLLNSVRYALEDTLSPEDATTVFERLAVYGNSKVAA